MQLDSIKLKNFKIHRDREFQFKPGINGIVGRNGIGKSTVTEAIRFLYTGALDETKDRTITIGEADGYVRGTFTLNNKQGTLERHLGSSKVRLRYDGKDLNKAVEVKELWSNLLQIDESIFNNVIIARQGEIPLLFSGNDTVREKIFQKIFLVPNTEKLRTTLWENYIKTCPPELPTEDISILRASMTETVGKLNPIREKIDDVLSRIMNDATVSSVLTRITFLKKCIEDIKERPTLEVKLKDLVKTEEETKARQLELETKLKTLDYHIYKKHHDQLLINKQLIGKKEQLERQLLVLQNEKFFAEYDEVKSVIELQTKEQIIAKLTEELGAVKAAYTNYIKTVSQFDTLQKHDKCPTCTQPLNDVKTFVDKQKALMQIEEQKLTRLTNELHDEKCSHSLLSTKIKDARSHQAATTSIQREIEGYGTVTFSEQEFSLVKAVLDQYQQIKDTINRIQNDLTRITGEIAVVTLKLKGLASYDGTSSPEKELDIMQQVLTVNGNRKEELNRLRIEEAKYDAEVNMLDSRVTSSFANEKKNEKRNKYYNILNSMYDLFHVSKFPRKLIESYSDVVQEYLLANTQKFNIPYRPRIAEGFKVEMLDTEGRVVPSVSGGQKVMVGLCLRLALHSLFAQSFPMWIVDEGTTHLDEENSKLYFELIRQMKAETTLKQIIIIDHNEMLADVVDNVIKV